MPTRILPAGLPIVSLVLLVLSAAPPVARATSDGPEFRKPLSEALQLHEDAEDYEQELEALEALEAVAERYPDEWLPLFWTSYLCTQIANLQAAMDLDEDPAATLELALRYFDQAHAQVARSNAPTTPQDRSSLFALYSLIHEFSARATSDEAERARHGARAEQALADAMRADKNNPVVLVLLGTRLIGEGTDGDDAGLILAGRTLLQSAQQAVDADPRQRCMTTMFNAEWIPFWMPMADASLADLLKTDRPHERQ